MQNSEKKSGTKKAKGQGKSWFQGLKAEYGKIVWTDRQTLINQTIVVTVITIILGALISLMDAGILGVLNLLIR